MRAEGGRNIIDKYNLNKMTTSNVELDVPERRKLARLVIMISERHGP
jgi:hypothetical protein